MTKRLIILSDLWGKGKASWIQGYMDGLKSDFEIHYYDCCDLGNIDTDIHEQDNLHQQFVEGGIERAVQQLLHYEKSPVHVLAFSIGGAIAWKAGLLGLDIQYLYAVSATRIRYETDKPKGHILCLFGEKDEYRPTSDWFAQLQVDYDVIPDQTHYLYTEEDFIQEIITRFIRGI